MTARHVLELRRFVARNKRSGLMQMPREIEEAGPASAQLMGSLIFLVGVTLSELFRCFEGAEGHASGGIEPMTMLDAPGSELFRACLDFHGDSALAKDVFVRLSRSLLPLGVGGREDVGILE